MISPLSKTKKSIGLSSSLFNNNKKFESNKCLEWMLKLLLVYVICIMWFVNICFNPNSNELINQYITTMSNNFTTGIQISGSLLSSSSTIRIMNEEQQQQQNENNNHNNNNNKNQNIIQQQFTKKEVRTDKQHEEDETEFHIVFSTGCNALQTWESYFFFYSLWRSGQKGNVTRVASGCTDDEAKIVQEQFEKNIRQGIPTGERFHLHLTPDYTRVHQSTMTDPQYNKSYNFFNKPYGIKHWFDHKVGFGHNLQNGGIPYYEMPNHINKNTIIIILDPDQIILKPFKVDYTDDTFVRLYPDDTKLINGTIYKIQKGKPFSQVYLFGGDYQKLITGSNRDEIIAAAANVSNQRIQMNHITPNNNGLLTWNKVIADTKYAAGPPYIGVIEDMYNIVTTWCAIVVPVYKHTHDHLSEMFAYSTASAYLQLEHTLFSSFMISLPNLHRGEGWHSLNNISHEKFVELSQPDYQYRSEIPEILHYCQRYYMGPYFFTKYKVPKNILDCNQPLLLEPPYTVIIDNITKQRKVILSAANKHKKCADVVKDYSWSRTPDFVNQTYNLFEGRHHTFALCHFLPKLNDAVLYWKSNHCPTGYNSDKSYVFCDYYEDQLQTLGYLP